MPLDLQVDQIVTRQELNAVYGGGIQGGMLTPVGGRYIFLFSDPGAGSQYGYTWDGWENNALETFFYTGEGSDGDQEFTRRNRILRDSALEGREVHVFVADGYRDNSRERTHRYMGQFSIDPQDPWCREDAQDLTGALRSVIVFRLNRLSTYAPPQTHTESRTPEPAKKSSVTPVSPEGSNATEFSRGAQEETVAVRRERILEDTFHGYLRATGGQPGRLKIALEGHAGSLLTDTWDAAGRELYEAKGSVTRNNVRLAIGQLLDYRRHINPPPARCTVLLPTDPGEDLTHLIHSSGMDLVYQEGNTFVRREAESTRAVASLVPNQELEVAKEAVRISSASFPELRPKTIPSARTNQQKPPVQPAGQPAQNIRSSHTLGLD